MSDALPVVAVVPTFRPAESATELVVELARQVSAVLISDDASPCTADPLLFSWQTIPHVHVIRHETNAGIARGLNDGVQWAKEQGSEWLLTVDQDSILPRRYVSALLAAARDRVQQGENLGAIGAQTIADNSGHMNYPLNSTLYGSTTEELIQTGTLWNVSALSIIGGFDESLGIDAVDAAACLGLRQCGYSIGVAEGLSLKHQIGQSRTVRIAGRSVMVTGHSPERRASMLRNRLRLFPAEFRQSPRHALRTLRRVAVNQSVGLVVEKGRWKKAKGSIRGIVGERKDNLTP